MTNKYRPSELYPENWNKLRFAIFKRDRYICQMCGVKCKVGHGWRSPQCHHNVPVKCGGSHSWDNLVTLCKRCHKLVHKEYIEDKNVRKSL